MTLMTSLPTAIMDFAFTGVLPGNHEHRECDGLRVVSVDALRLFEDRRTEAFQSGLRRIVAARLSDQPPGAFAAAADLTGEVLYVSSVGTGAWEVRSGGVLKHAASTQGAALRAADALVRRSPTAGRPMVLLRCDDGLWRDRTPN